MRLPRVRPPSRKRPFRPPEREVARFRGLPPRGGIGDALVKDHDDVGPDRPLGLDAVLGRHEVAGTIQVRPELKAVGADTGQSLEAEDLESTAVREHRAVPRHEAVDAAGPPDDVDARPEGEVIRVREDDLGADGMQV